MVLLPYFHKFLEYYVIVVSFLSGFDNFYSIWKCLELDSCDLDGLENFVVFLGPPFDFPLKYIISCTLRICWIVIWVILHDLHIFECFWTLYMIPLLTLMNYLYLMFIHIDLCVNSNDFHVRILEVWCITLGFAFIW